MPRPIARARVSAVPVSRQSLRRLAFLLGGLAMFGPFSIETIFPAFPQIGAQLGANPVQMQQTISVYLIAYALMSVVHGPLSDAIGRRRVILGGLAVFVLASIGCALSDSVIVFDCMPFSSGWESAAPFWPASSSPAVGTVMPGMAARL